MLSRLIQMPGSKRLSPSPTSIPLSRLDMTTDSDSITGDEEVPLLSEQRTHERLERTPFPWVQFSILFTVTFSQYLTLNIQFPFIPDVTFPVI